ncbi:MAG: hypothetical protein ACOCXM_01245 [Myxococcota bacterium]
MAALAVLIVGGVAWPYTVDDAYIVARYAQHLADGHGYVMNPGADPSDGVTGPLWLLPMSLGVPWAKGLGLLSGGLAAGLATRFAQAHGGAWAGAGTALFVAVQSTLGIWSVAGLEAGAATLALVVAVIAALAVPRPRPLGAGVPVALLAWLRPETVAAALVAVLVAWARDRRMGVRAALIGLSGLAGVVAFRWALFGQPLPLTMAARPPELGHGMAYVGRAVAATTGGLALVPITLAVARGGWRMRAIGLAAAVHLGAVILAGGDWMPGYRLVAPMLPLLAILVGGGMAALRVGRPARVAVLAACCALPALDAITQLPRAREAGRRRETIGAPLARWMGARYGSIAIVDAGYLAWASGARVVDLAGLTEPAVGRAPGGHLDKRFDPGVLVAASPDAVVLHSSRPPRFDASGVPTALAGHPVERRVAEHPWLRAHYRVARVVPYAPRYYYVILARSGPP